MNNEKTPYPPAYAEVYPIISQPEPTAYNAIGWQQQPPEQSEGFDVQPTQPAPPAYSPIQQPVATASVLRNQSRIGLYPIKLTPCPSCLRETKTTISFATTLKTHLFALILCVACCWCCAPLPYVTNNATKTANHFCENCKMYIGSYDRNPCKW
ncbi:lipopolysaccharide-induced tumor necrosis factor-alpha factor homolog [Chironomus tepperi]|uniref:lipopolysaccharide-induced tumor necrosis factor-alpha factor homolog n=1 Tax=Chironomus tepperi TaxID=113505 RepID=UPI00391F7573